MGDLHSAEPELTPLGQLMKVDAKTYPV